MKGEIPNEESVDFVEPYRILFPFGVFAGIVGVFLWIFFQYRWIGFYPRAPHGNLMFFGFFWSFVAGFLMTAIPKMLRTRPANYFELFLACLLVLLQIAFSIRNEDFFSAVVYGMQNIFLLTFLLSRLHNIEQIPFSGFIFLPAAMLQSLLGLLCYFYFKDRTLFLYLSGEAFLVNLIFGLGSRLIPVISRLPGALLPTERNAASRWLPAILVLVILNLSYLLSFFGADYVSLAWLFKSLGLFLGAFILLKIHEKPTSWTAIGIGLKLAIVLMLLGSIGAPFFSNFRIAFLHIFYIGGLSLVTVLISFRVMLAHGGASLSYEVSAPRIYIISVLMVAASFLRFLSGSNPIDLKIFASIVFFTFSLALWTNKFSELLRGKTP
ncbi:MAG: NnrS family protein [Oligoflexia bacterium]|nr:NnrS family protein [Oligoflexia bacterium]